MLILEFVFTFRTNSWFVCLSTVLELNYTILEDQLDIVIEKTWLNVHEVFFHVFVVAKFSLPDLNAQRLNHF